jgi:hypothetical protein
MEGTEPDADIFQMAGTIFNDYCGIIFKNE